MHTPENVYALCQRLTQYARLACGRILGTTSSSNGGYKAIRSLDEARLLHRCELSALTTLLIEHGVFTNDEFREAFAHELEDTLTFLKGEWPEVDAEPHALIIRDIKAHQQRSRLEGWPP